MNGTSDVISETNGFPRRRQLSSNGDTNPSSAEQQVSPRSPTTPSYRSSTSVDAGLGVMTSSVVAEEFTRCFLCEEIFVAPKMLACMHSFCLQCLQLYVKRQRSNKSKSSSDGVSERRVFKENRKASITGFLNYRLLLVLNFVGSFEVWRILFC